VDSSAGSWGWRMLKDRGYCSGNEILIQKNISLHI
jgi:hypothetical protein